MKISLIFFALTTSLLSQSQDTQIKDYFNSLNNKTILIEIFENQSVFNANISLNDPKIYFETIEVDSTISLFENDDDDDDGDGDKILAFPAFELLKAV